ncbi:serine hydrolase domain-containing protein [Paenibacillus ginsengarvi]|uniref:Class A beta-lactamase-related serine hydrolase n=1 Tax=Paenibacillus ginsengarvi TaxID=400777 RepID=A0A3B0CKM4_9BACL|nr:serine hydrolase domain-containing protein [Paenibacillus ginsengarvi]RKN86245.1 class A beta-lactamase-related serine hydrolase [Paenibacillus ginsengarvi]
MKFFISSECSDSSFNMHDRETLRSRMDEYLRAYEQLDYFSGSVLVAHDGEIVLNEGYGMANREHEVKNTRDTIFRLGSVSKSFTAAAIILLHEQGVLNTDQPISRYLADFPNGDTITIHHLLTHTSGLSHPVGLNTKVAMKLENVIQKFRDQPLAFSPGDQFQYGNSGYILLTYLIEQVSGKPFESFLQDHFFHPLGMFHSGYDVHNRILKHRADGYSAAGDEVVHGEYAHMSTHAGAAGLYSSTGDLSLWDQALHSELLFRRQTRERIFTPFLQNYGYGWYIDRQSLGGRLRTRIHHGGLGNPGYVTRMTRFADERLLIIVLSNFLLSPLEKMNRDLAGMIFGETEAFPDKPEIQAQVQPMRYEAFAGIYEAFIRIHVTVEQERLFITIFGFKLELFFQSEAAEQIDFYAKAAYVRISFRKKFSGQIDGATIHWLGEEAYYAKRRDGHDD